MLSCDVYRNEDFCGGADICIEFKRFLCLGNVKVLRLGAI